jgi:hypothetical protein
VAQWTRQCPTCQISQNSSSHPHSSSTHLHSSSKILTYPC